MAFYSHFAKNELGEKKLQTVNEHCRNTAKYAKNILMQLKMGSAGYLAGLVHDMGKMKQEFQEYLLDGKGYRGSVNHTFAGCRLLLSQFHGDCATTCEDLNAELLAFAVGAHHGLFDCVDCEGRSGFLHRLDKEGIGYTESKNNYLNECVSMDELAEWFHSANAELMPVYEGIGKLSGASDEEFAFYEGLLARLLLSALIEADRSDTAEFVTGVPRLQETQVNDGFWKERLAYLEEKLSAFSTETPIQQARAVISMKCSEYGGCRGGVLRLNVPTGGGKTLSSLRFALSHAAKWNKTRLIFTSPLLTILEQNAAVIREYLGDDSVVLEHHSNVLDIDDASELDLRELSFDNWHSPVIITTLVQFLNTLFSGKTAAIRRFHSLCNSVIVIDEVQTVPSNMLSLFDLAVNFLTDICGATVVLCSATQPCFEQVQHPIRPIPPQIVPYEKTLWTPFQRTRIIDGGAMTMEETVEFIRNAMNQVNSLLVVCNKKEQARYLSGALDCVADVCCHLSAAMCPAHRRQTLEKLNQALEAGGRCLCIATQVIEAGVDISFQRVIRLTAGMDSVIQAAGRCNRNAENENLPVYVVTLLDENLGRLEEINRGKNATISLLDAYRREPAQFGNDLASDVAINYYYKRFYGSMAREAQDYPIKKEHVSLFTLLSDNRHYWDNDSSFFGRFMLNQAFRKAGEAFTVFDSDTQDVIVPFGDGRRLIEELIAHKTDDVLFMKQWISRAKEYTVSLYVYQIQALSDVIADYGGIKVLPPEFYDAQTGFILKPGTFDFLEV